MAANARNRTRQSAAAEAYAAKNIWEECGKCLGTGSVSWGADFKGVVYNSDGTSREVPQVCFKCDGTGGKYVSQKQLDRREASRARRERRKAEEQAAKTAAHQERVANARRRWDAVPGNTELAEQLHTLGEFGESLAEALATWGCLTDRQAEAARTALARRAEEAAAPTAPVPTGRTEVQGTVVSVKDKVTQYGVSVKMVVRDDRGFKVWGTVPAALADAACQRWEDSLPEGTWMGQYGGEAWFDTLQGATVRFTAQLQASDTDEAFGFFKRPTKAQLI